MDWNKSSAIGTWVGVVLMALTLGWMVWPTIHPTSGWPAASSWPIVVGAAALIISARMHLTAARINREASSERLSSPALPAKRLGVTIGNIRVAEQPREQSPRVVINKLPSELAAPFEQFTKHQATKIIDDWLGKEVRWSVRISDLDADPGGGASVVCRLVDRKEDIPITAAFPPDRAGQVLHLSKGAEILLHGRIDRIQRYWIYLDDCRVVSE